MPTLATYWQHLQPERLLRLLLPSHCALCLASCPAQLCAACQQAHLSQHLARCLQCGLPGAATPCGLCVQQLPAYDATVVAASYLPPVDQLVLALKFGHNLALANLFAHLLRDAMLQTQSNHLHQAILPLPDLLLPVPLGRQRLSERGFNQALEIARPLAHALGIELRAQLLLRERDTDAQARLHTRQRARNVRHAFALAPGAHEHIVGRHIGLVDDVMTTGATLNELAATLKRYGATRVTNLVFARTPPPA